MSQASYIIVGRSADCDVELTDPTVSGRHARLSWSNGRILVEDLGSANGTFVRGQRVTSTEVRPGEELRLGRCRMRWSDPAVRGFLRRGARGDTIQGVSIPGRRFICGACGARGVMPSGFGGGELRCGLCRTRLRVGKPKASRVPWAAAAASLAALGVVAGFVWHSSTPDGSPLHRAAEQLGLEGRGVGLGADSPQEASIRMHTAPRVVEAIDVTHPLTRNTAARIAAEDQGPFKVEQVARIWSHVRRRWRYVNDPRGSEYFSAASETIENEFVGDCDDFAILVSAMIGAVGGEARIVMMDGPRGGHAYAEACVLEGADEVRRRLSRHYLKEHQRVRSIHFRPSDRCPVWLNLDWNAGVPGGPYEPESWAVAIYPDGTTETLDAAGEPMEQGSRMRASSPPR